MSMPGIIAVGSSASYFGQNLTDFVANNTIAQARLDDMATRILAAWYYLGQDDASYPPGKAPAGRFRINATKLTFLLSM